MAPAGHNVSIQYTRNGAQRDTYNYARQVVPYRDTYSPAKSGFQRVRIRRLSRAGVDHAPQVHRDESLLGVDVVIDSEKGELETAVDSKFVEDMGQVVLDSLFTE